MTNSKYFSMITRNSFKPYQLGAIKGDLPHVVRAGEITRLARAAKVIEFETALASLSEAIRLGTLDDYSVQALAFRAAYESLGVGTGAGPDLSIYDEALMAISGDHS